MLAAHNIADLILFSQFGIGSQNFRSHLLDGFRAAPAHTHQLDLLTGACRCGSFLALLSSRCFFFSSTAAGKQGQQQYQRSQQAYELFHDVSSLIFSFRKMHKILAISSC